MYAAVATGSLVAVSGMLLLYAMRSAEAGTVPEHLQPVHYVDLAIESLDAKSSTVQAGATTISAFSQTSRNPPIGDNSRSSNYALPKGKR